MSDRPDEDKVDNAPPSVKKGKQARQIRFLPKTIILEETSTLPLVLWSIATICLIVFLLIIWAGFTKVRETAVTMGEVIPSGRVQVIQHLEGGIVKNLYIKDGDTVKKGQVLVELDPTEANAELEQQQSRELAITLDLFRLNAFINGQAPTDAEWHNSVSNLRYANPANQAEIDRLIASGKQLLNLQNMTRNDQRDVLISQVQQREQELAKLLKQRDITSVHLAILTKEKNMYDELGKNSPISQRDYLDLQQQINQAQGDLNQLPGQIQQAKDAVGEIQNRIDELNSNAYQTASQQISDLSTELIQVRHAIQKLQDRVMRLKMVAPVQGIVQGLEAKPGSVIQPGGMLMTIVPLDETLVVKTKINTRDIGQVKVGNTVRVRVMAFDYTRYGEIDGKVVSISPTTFTDQTSKQPYYEGIVSLAKQYVGDDPQRNRLIPGMTVQADITTGEKSILSYLLKPIETTVSSAFGER